jgi:outer membrane biogenesis lipoprotein LolB
MKFIVVLVLGSLFLTGCTGDKEDSAKTADSADSAAE